MDSGAVNTSSGAPVRPAVREPAAPARPSALDAVLTRLRDDGEELFGGAVSRIETLRRLDRPFSTVAQVKLTLPSRTSYAYVKLLKPRADNAAEVASMRGNVQRDFEMTRDVRNRLTPFEGLSTVRPIVCYPEHLAMVTEQAEGPTLSALLRHASRFGARGVAAAERVVSEAGRWLKAAQAVLPADRDVTAAKMRAYISVRLDALSEVQLDPRAATLTAEGRAGLEALRDRLLDEAAAELQPVWIHADYCPENIIAGRNATIVLDFTMAKGGTKYHDVSHLFLRLETMKAKPWSSGAAIDRLQAALLHGFEAGLHPSRPLFELLLFQHIVCHMVSMSSERGGLLHRWQVGRQQGRHRRWLARRAGLPVSRMFRAVGAADRRLAGLRTPPVRHGSS